MENNNLLNSPDNQAILKKRAALLAAEKLESDLQEQDFLLSFYIGEEKYAINYEHIERIIPYKNITPIPCVSSNIEGIIYHDGETITVFNLSRILHILMQTSAIEKTNFILIPHQNTRIALWVDTIIGQIAYKKDSPLATLTCQQSHLQELFQGIYQAEITLLNTNVFFEHNFIHKIGAQGVKP